MTGAALRDGQLATRETLAIFARALRYVAPFRGRFALKIGLTLLSLAPFLVLPWPTKLLIDHVVDAAPLGPALGDFPFFLRPLLALLVPLSATAVLGWTIAFMALLVIAVGAMGTTGRERDQTDAYLSEGQDTATRTENQANAGWSFAGGLLGLADFRFTVRLTQALNHHYRSRLFERIKALPMTAFDDERIGDAIFRVMYDTPTITEAAYRLVLTPIAAPTAIVATALMLWHVFGERPALFWAALGFLPGVLIVTLPFAGPIRRRGLRSRGAGSEATTSVEEGVTNILAVQSLGGQGREGRRFARDSWDAFGRYRALLWIGMLTTLVALVPGLFLVRWAFLYVADLVIAGAISKGDFLVLLGYFFQLAFYATELGALWIRVQESAPGLSRVFLLMDAPGEIDAPAAGDLAFVRREIRVEDAHFAYPDGTEALRGVSFEARVGEITAFVGPVGAGKTTLAYLIPRFIEPARGRVLVDGVDVAAFTHRSLRDQVAFVFQENVLFDGTIEENIRLGNLSATELDVRRAAQLAGAEEFIRSLPDGYRTRLGRAGARLSVGQKQRLSIARALVRDAPILILDEPTSALDTETEQRLVESLHAAARTRIVIVVAHRLSTVRAAHQILFLDSGRILERGRPDDLLTRPGGAYRRFVELQTRGVA